MFRGETPGLNGNVFQTLAESHDPTQFKCTLEALERFSNKVYQVDLRQLFSDDISLPVLDRPKRPAEGDEDNLEVEEYREELKEFVKERKNMSKALRSLFSVIWGQCSPSVTTRLLAIEGLQDWKENGRVDELLKTIRQVMVQHQHRRCAYVTLFRELRQFYAYRQRDNQTLHKYLEVFQVQVENIKRSGGSLGEHDIYVQEMMDRDQLLPTENGVSAPVMKKYVESAQQKFLAIAFLLGGRVEQYGDLIRDLENDYLKGKDFFPDNTTDAYNLMSNYVQRKGAVHHTNRAQVRQNGLGFMQTKAKSHKTASSQPVPGTDGVVHDRISCYTCGQKGHYSHKCPVALLQDGSAPADTQEAAEPNIVNDNVNGYNPETHEDFSPGNEHMGFGFMQIQVSLFQSQKRQSGINKNWVLLDTQSNCDIFMNPRLLCDIRPSPTGSLILKSNGGEMEASEVGNIPGYGKVWYNSDSMANILSFANVRKKCKISFETGPDDPSPTIVVHRSTGKPMLFKEHALGLYVHDTTEKSSKSSLNLNSSYDYSFLTTIKQLESTFTKFELQKANEVLTLSRRLGCPSQATLRQIIVQNKIRGCDLSVEDFQRAMYIYGTRSTATIKGKTVRDTPLPVSTTAIIPLPVTIATNFSSVTIYVDIFYVHGLAFFHTISKHFLFRTVETIGAHTTRNLLTCIQNVINQYNARELLVDHIYGDPEFLPLVPSVLPSVLHVCGKGDHVPNVERSIRTIKDRCRAIIHGLPFTHYTKLMVHSLVYFVVRRLNSFPCRPGLHPDYSPTVLITGQSNPSMKELSAEYGQYVQMHDNVSVPRTTMSRTTGGIALLPANRSGSWFFMSLSSGKRVLRSAWTTLPFPADVIDRVASLALHDLQADSLFSVSEGAILPQDQQEDPDTPEEHTLHQQVELNAHDTNNDYELANDDNDDLEPDANEDEESIPDEANAPHNPNEIADNTLVTDTEDSDSDDDTSTKVNDQNRDSATDNDMENRSEDVTTSTEEKRSEDVTPSPEEKRSEETSENRSEEPTNEKINQPIFDGQVPNEEDATMSKREKQESIKRTVENKLNRYNLRSSLRKSKESRFNRENYSYLLVKRSTARWRRKIKSFEEYQDGLNDEIENNNSTGTYNQNDFHTNAVGTCMTQMSARKGVKVFGDRAIDAMKKEYSQLEELGVFEPLQKHAMTHEMRMGALQVIDLIKEKRCGRIKGRTVVDGRAQRGQYTKLETSSSALTLEAFIATLAVDALEGRDVAVADIAGAFLKADQPDCVIIKMRGPAVKAILLVNALKYNPYVVVENNEKVIYLRLIKAMYGTLTAPLLWYKLFARTLIDLGFQINRYDPCVANKIVNGQQFTICWYVDDLKLSHVEPKEVTKMLEILNVKFKQMSITRGSKHTYLGMNFEIKNKKVYMEMQSYLDECIMAFGESVVSSATTPASKSLMEINSESKVLEEERKTKFHHIVQKLLHICKRTRLDLQVAIGFLCTRVRQPTLQDWHKLRRVIQYVHGTRELKRIISISSFNRIDIFIDASHGIHRDYRGQTGGCVTMGDGVIHGRSSKQTLNSKSSTETELIGVSDYLPYPIWLINFYSEQGYEIKRVVLQQDNESTIRMLTNGRRSCGPKSRHIGIRFFWSTNRLQLMRSEIEHCPTTRMLADFFTKPLQGKLFRTMRDVVHGLAPYGVLNDEDIDMHDKDIEKSEKSKLTDDSSTCIEERVGEMKSKETKIEKRVSFVDDVEFLARKNNVKTYAEAVKPRTI